MKMKLFNLSVAGYKYRSYVLKADIVHTCARNWEIL
jgi:hypothetical protein